MIWDILAIAGASNSEIMLTCGIDMLMIGFGAGRGATPGYKKWIFWVIAWLTIVLWTFYPIAWVLAEGGHMVSCTAEAGIYMVLDVLSKCMFGFVIVSARGALDSISNEKAGYNSV